MAVIEKLKLSTGWYFYTKLIVATVRHWNIIIICDIWLNIRDCPCMELILIENCAIDNWYCITQWDRSLLVLLTKLISLWTPEERFTYRFYFLLHCWLDYAMQYLRVAHCNPIGTIILNIELNSLIQTGLPPPGKICWTNQSMHPVKAVKAVALNCWITN